MLEKAVVIGIGYYFAAKKPYIMQKYNVVGLIDPSGEHCGKFHEDIPVLSVKDLKTLTYDKVIIATIIGEIKPSDLFAYGVKYDQIELLLKVEPFVANEDLLILRPDVDYEIMADGFIYCKIDNLHIAVETNNELYIIKEIFCKGEYNFSLPEKDIVVIDIGMNIGCASLFFANRTDVKKVYSFEPFPETFLRAKHNIATNNLFDKIIPFNLGASDKNEHVSLQYTPDLKGLMSTVFDNKAVCSQNTETVQVEMCDISNFMQVILEDHSDSPILMKIDCEGAEFEILGKMVATNILNKISMIILEWHRRDVKILEKYFIENGFAILTTLGSKTPPVGMLVAVNMKLK